MLEEQKLILYHNELQMNCVVSFNELSCQSYLFKEILFQRNAQQASRIANLNEMSNYFQTESKK